MFSEDEDEIQTDSDLSAAKTLKGGQYKLKKFLGKGTFGQVFAVGDALQKRT